MATTIYHVKPTGSDLLTGLSEALAFRTPEKAMAVASTSAPGDLVVMHGTFHDEVVLDRDFPDDAPLTFMRDVTDDAMYDGQYTLPAGPDQYVNPDDPSITGNYKSLVSVTAHNIRWGVHIYRSRGRGFGANPATATPTKRPRNVHLFGCWINHCRNACYIIQECDNPLVKDVVHSFGGDFYTPERDPAVTNWPVTGSLLFCTSPKVENCLAFRNAGEGISLARGTTNAECKKMVSIDNLSVQFYMHRTTGSWYDRCVAINTGAVYNPNTGFAVENEKKFPDLTPCSNLRITNCVGIGSRHNFALRAGDGTGDPFNNIVLAFNTSYNARQKPGFDVWAGVLAAGVEHTLINLYGNCVLQDSLGKHTNASGDLSGYTRNYQAWPGTGTAPQSSLTAGNDVAGVVLANTSLNPSTLFTPASTYEGNLAQIDTIFAAISTAMRPTAEHAIPLPANIGSPAMAIPTWDFMNSPRSSTTTLGAVQFAEGGGGGGGGGGANRLQTIRQAAATAAGNQTFTFPAGTSDNCAALRIHVVPTITEDTPVDSLSVSTGFFVGSSEQAAVAVRSAHGQNPSDTDRRNSSTSCVVILNALTNAILAEGVGVSWTGDVFTLNWTTAPPAAWLVVVEALPFTDASIHYVVVNGTQNASTTFSVAHDWNTAVAIGNSRSLDAGFLVARYSQGFAKRVGSTVTQVGVGWYANNAVSPTTEAARFVNSRFGAHVNVNGGIIRTVELAITTGNDAELITRDGTPADTETYIILLGQTDLDVWVGFISLPSSASTVQYTDPGFPVGAVSLLSGFMTAVGTGYGSATGALAGAWGISILTEDNDYSLAVADRHNVATSDSQSLERSIPIDLRQHDGSAGMVGASWDSISTGFEIVYSTAALAGNAMALAFGEDATISGEATVVFDPIELVAAGFVGSPFPTIVGVAVLAFGDLVLDATGVASINGVADLSWGALALDAAGTSGSAVTGVADLSWGALALTASGSLGGSGQADLQFGALSLTAAGSVAVHGEATIGFGTLVLDATALSPHSYGEASLQFGPIILDAAGTIPITGEATLNFFPLILQAHAVLTRLEPLTWFPPRSFPGSRSRSRMCD